MFFEMTYSQKTETDRPNELAHGDGARHLEVVDWVFCWAQIYWRFR
jgi:hypothetical protein